LWRDSNDQLGASIAIENNIVVVGAPYDNSASGFEYAGSVYILDTGFSSPTTELPSTNSLSDGAIVGMATVAGVTVVVIVLGIAIYNYCIKIPQQPPPPPPPQPQQQHATADDEAPIMADVVMEPLVSRPPINNRTLEVADVFLDPAEAAMAQIRPPARFIDKPSGEILPRYKDQVMAVEPPRPFANLPSSVAAAAEKEEEDDESQEK
jgi:hypothetical protein